MTRREVIIVGGSLAGAACARELDRLGIDVVALERDRFPRPKVCGGFVSPGAVSCLERLGVLDRVLEAGAVRVDSARVRIKSAAVDIPFERPGLGISRATLDSIVAADAPIRQGCGVRDVKREGGGFRVDEMACSVVIDASGKLSRLTRRRETEEFGVQYGEVAGSGARLDFSFFEDGYGGTVSVEGGSSNSCFLIQKEALRKYLRRKDCLVTGPLAYERVPGAFIAIGDAAGMVDPFCGEGMRHALETGILAAGVVAGGLRRGAGYEEIKATYEREYSRRWAARKAVGAMIRRLVGRRSVLAGALRLTPAWLLNRMWR